MDPLSILLTFCGLYLAVGFLFALYFCFRAVGRVDPLAAKAGFGLRLLLLPAVARDPLDRAPLSA